MRTGEPLGVWRFGEFTLDRDNRVLLRAGLPVPADPKVLDCLELLCADAGQLVSLERLRAALWPGLSVGPGALRKLMTGVRRALSQGGAAAELIHTRRGLGYTFTGAVARDAAVLDWPFIGRAHELALLERACVRPGSTRGALCLVAGEAGAGKSTLLARVRAVRATTPWLSGHCQPGASVPAFWPWRQIAGQLARVPQLKTPLRAAVSRDRALGWLLPELAPGRAPARESGVAGELRFAYCQAFARTLCELAQRMPLAIALEDAHWADDGSLLLLELLARGVAEHPLSVFVSYRPEEVAQGGWLGELLARVSGRPNVHEAQVFALTPAELQSLLCAVQHPGSAPHHAAELQRLTGGNALFARQLIQHSLATDGVPGQGEPASLAHLVAARVQRLPEATRVLLELGSALGVELELPLMAAIAGRPVTALREQLEPGVRAGLLTHGAGRLQFAHVLLRESLLNGLPSHVREAHHVAALRALSGSPGAACEQLAGHAYLAGAALAVAARRQLCEQAGREALAALAFDRAALHLGRALSLRAPDAVDRADAELSLLWARARWEADHPAAEVERAFKVACERARRAAAPELFAEAAIGCAIGGDESVSRMRGVAQRPAALALLEEALQQLSASRHPELHARVARSLLLARGASGELAAARELALTLQPAALPEDLFQRALALVVRALAQHRYCAADARDLAQRLTASTLTPQAQMEAGFVILTYGLAAGELGAFEQTLASMERAVARLPLPPRFGRLGERLSGYFAVPPVGRVALAIVRGQLSAAVQGFGQLRAFAEQAGLTGSHAEQDYMFLLLWLLHGYRGDAHLLEPLAASLLGQLPAAPWHLRLVSAEAALSRAEHAIARAAFAELRASDFRPVQAAVRLPSKPETLARLADVCVAVGTRADAELLYRELEVWADHHANEGGLVSRGAMARPLGALALQLGDAARAEQHLRRALALNRSMGHRPETARSLFALGELLSRTGRSEGAALAAEARAEAQAMGMKL